MKITVFLGPPGSGKGTQAKLLTTNGAVQHVSTGDMFRRVIRGGSPLGTQLKAILDAGDLVPDSLTLQILQEEIAKLPKSTETVILDGYPRNAEQAKALDSQKGFLVTSAVFFKMPQPDLLARLSGRRVCKNCGETFHTVFAPPRAENTCDRCGGPLYQRPDDQEQVVQKRLSIYEQQTAPLLDYYRHQGKLKTVQAQAPITEVHGALTQILS